MKPGSKILIAAVLLAATIFLVDIELPLGVAGGVPYVAVVLLALWSPDPRMPLYVAAGCSILTALGFVFSPHGSVFWVVIVNRALAVFAIWVTAVLSVRWRSAQRRMSQQQERLERVSAEASLLAVKAGRLGQAELSQDLEAISNAAERSGAIVHRLRDLIANRELERSSHNMNRLIHETIRFMYHDIEHSNTIVHLELWPALPAVFIDSVQIQQVIVNLVRNAIEAMDGMPQKSLTIRSTVDDSGGVEVVFSDSGAGLGDTPIDSIFEHFVSTKRDGLGVGLAISRSIIEAHLGHLAVERNTDRGMSFRFSVPGTSTPPDMEAVSVGG